MELSPLSNRYGYRMKLVRRTFGLPASDDTMSTGSCMSYAYTAYRYRLYSPLPSRRRLSDKRIREDTREARQTFLGLWSFR